MKHLSTTSIAKLCGCSRVWAWKMARDAEIPGERIDRAGKQYRYKDSPKLRSWCAAIKAERDRARLPKPRSRLQGVSTWEGSSTQFNLLLRGIGDDWKNWTVREVEWVRAQIAPVLEFDRKLSNRKFPR